MDPELEPLPDEDALAARGRLLVADAVAATRAPLALRERLEAQRTTTAPPRRRLAIFGLAAAALAAIALVAVLVTGGGSGSSPGGPGVLAVAQVAARPPTGPAPRPTGDGFVDARVDPVRFPDWRGLAWPARGQRTDVVAGRRVRTVFYAAPDGTTVGYAVVAGAPLPSRERRASGGWAARPTRVLEADGDRVVTWRQGGRTCVLRAPSTPSEGNTGCSLRASWAPA